MARNKVQFQKGLSEAGFEALYGTEAKCRAVVIGSRWPNGFECPVCGGRAYCEVTTRGLFQCSACRHQASPIAGTIFASTHLPLRLWFRAMYHLTQSKQGISSWDCPGPVDTDDAFQRGVRPCRRPVLRMPLSSAVK